jgi:hypothetical protein
MIVKIEFLLGLIGYCNISILDIEQKYKTQLSKLDMIL